MVGKLAMRARERTNDFQDRDGNSVESVRRDEDVARVFTTNVRQRVETDADFKVPVRPVEPFAARPVDGAGDVSRTRQANADPLWAGDRGRDRQGGMRPACARWGWRCRSSARPPEAQRASSSPRASSTEAKQEGQMPLVAFRRALATTSSSRGFPNQCPTTRTRPHQAQKIKG